MCHEGFVQTFLDRSCQFLDLPVIEAVHLSNASCQGGRFGVFVDFDRDHLLSDAFL